MSLHNVGMSDVTRILSSIDAGDPRAAEELLPLVYDELRKLAAAKLAHEKPGQTLQATALVHEAYLRLVGGGKGSGIGVQGSGPRGGEGESGGDPHPDPLSKGEGESGGRWDSRGHFFAAAAEAMRRILVDVARRKKAEKRGGESARHDLDQFEIIAADIPEDLVSLDSALDELAAVDKPAADLVHLRYFAGLSMSEAAEALGISERTAARIWAYARAWLRQKIEGSGAST